MLVMLPRRIPQHRHGFLLMGRREGLPASIEAPVFLNLVNKEYEAITKVAVNACSVTKIFFWFSPLALALLGAPSLAYL
jgi:hypothetical protein